MESEIRLCQSNSTSSVAAELTIGDINHPLYFRCKGDVTLTKSVMPFLVGAVPPLMKAGVGSVRINGVVSQKVLAELESIQRILCGWYPQLRSISVVGATPTSDLDAYGDRVGAFFTGGVDSFYTLLKHQDEITDLIFMHGYDVRLSDSKLRGEVSKRINIIAKHYGKNVIEVETNLREGLLDKHVRWGLGHGAALAAVAHLLSPAFQRIYISSTDTTGNLRPLGSHPDLDPLWSAEHLEFVHYGCDTSRVEKTAYIAENDFALLHLRVCYRNPKGSYNCGACEKCLRTMLNLEACDALHRCTTFENELKPESIARVNMSTPVLRASTQENIDALERRGGNEALVKALKKSLSRPQWHFRIKRFLLKTKHSIAKRLPM